MANKHPAPDGQPVELPDDLEENPGIGQSKGLFGRASPKDAELIEGVNTIEGDSDNDAGLGGGINPDPGRTNE
jgi:hypothetical protein